MYHVVHTLHTEKLFMKNSITEVLISFFFKIALLPQLLRGLLDENTFTLHSFDLHINVITIM